jgi:hypothetical protein
MKILPLLPFFNVQREFVECKPQKTRKQTDLQKNTKIRIYFWLANIWVAICPCRSKFWIFLFLQSCKIDNQTEKKHKNDFKADSKISIKFELSVWSQLQERFHLYFRWRRKLDVNTIFKNLYLRVKETSSNIQYQVVFPYYPIQSISKSEIKPKFFFW